jgi:hypothetical protein
MSTYEITLPFIHHIFIVKQIKNFKSNIFWRFICTIKKTHGTFEGTDKRGKHTPANKTSDETLDSIRQHIMSFPIMDSHYKRKRN